MPTYRTDQVFGIARDVPLNYVARPSVDELFVNSLTRDKHIVLHGSSKQGKTSMRKECLNPTDYVIVQCDSSWDLGELHGAILKEAGFEVTQSATKTTSGKNKAEVKAKVGFSFPGIGSTGVGGSVSAEDLQEEKRETRPLELDLYDANDIIRALSSVSFNQFLCLEDFHYLSLETQQRFAVALKAYHERSKFCFIIVGVWLEHDRLATYNGDLVGRIVSVNADEWLPEQLHSVIRKGEELLNVEFPADYAQQIVENSLQSVYIVQESCHRACTDNAVLDTASEKKRIVPIVDAVSLVKRVIDKDAPRFTTFLSRFGDGFQETGLQMFKWILFAIITASVDELESGLSKSELRKTIDSYHPEAPLNPGNLTVALQSVSSLQVKNRITPIVLDYDGTSRRLSVVDRSFLIWLAYQDKNDLLADLGITIAG